MSAYLADLLETDFTAKDFRTWNAVMAAESLATTEDDGKTRAPRRRAIKAAVAQVAEYLGNTVAVATSSYIDPRLIDLDEAGTTIEVAARTSYASPDRRRTALEAAVLSLLTGRSDRGRLVRA